VQLVWWLGKFQVAFGICGSSASNLEQVSNLLCAQVDLAASYPRWDENRVVAYKLRGSGMSALGVQLFTDAGNGWPHNVIRYH